MTSLGDVTSDVISISITLAYMVIIWIIVDKLKFLSGLLNIYKKPLYLLIIVTTIIPIYSILKRLLNGKSPLNISIGVNSTGTRQLRQMAGIENRFVMPSDPDSEYRNRDVANKEVDEAQYADPIKGDKVATDILDTNYQFGSPKDAKSRFILHGKICQDQDFLKTGTDEDGNPFEMIRVKWDLIANQSPRYCQNPGCIEGGDLSREYGAMNVSNEKFAKENNGSNTCITPYMKMAIHSTKRDVYSEDLDVAIKKQYKTFGQDLSVKQCMDVCDDDNECRGFNYNSSTKEVNFFGDNVVNDPEGIRPDGSAVNNTVYIKPPAISMVPLKSLVKPDKLPFCDPESSHCNPAKTFLFSGREFGLNEPFCISIDEIEPNPLGPKPWANFWQYTQNQIPSWYARVSLSDKPSECFSMRRASLRHGKMPYFKFWTLSTDSRGQKSSPLTTKCCSDNPVNTPRWAMDRCPKTARISMGGDNIPSATNCESQECSIAGQYCPPGVAGSSDNGKRCCPRDGRLLWRDGARDCSYTDRSYEVPDAASCHGQACDIKGQHCPPGRPGSTDHSGEGYRCCNSKWRRGASDCGV